MTDIELEPDCFEAPLRDASAVMLVRGAPEGRELFWVRRGRGVSLGGGFHALPGGRVDEQDAALAAAHGISGDDGPLRTAALRELFEETGVLLARTDADDAARHDARRALLAGAPFGETLARLRATLRPDVLHAAGRWKTPPFAIPRYDTRFFAALLPDVQSPEVWPGELAGGEWIRPVDALALWSKGKALLHPPALHLLRCLRDAPFPRCLPAMNAAPHCEDFVAKRIEFQDGVFLVPLHTPTVPPWTHTHAYVAGGEELVIIDPGSPWPWPQREAAAFCDGLRAEGRRFREILLTHAHPDHAGGARALARHLGIPVRAHADAAPALAGTVDLDGTVSDGEVVALAGEPHLRLRAVYTPGHARGHLCFLEETTGALFAGDMVAGMGTVVVDPPEGDMTQYVESLRRLKDLAPHTIYPEHGPMVLDAGAKLDEYVAHRAERERLVVAALSESGHASVEELVPKVYADTVQDAFPLAARSLLAVLEKLEREGTASRSADGAWSPGR